MAFLKTRDINLAALFVSQGHPVVATERDDRGRVLFCFQAHTNLERLRLGSLSGTHPGAKALAAREQLLDAVHAIRESRWWASS